MTDTQPDPAREWAEAWEEDHPGVRLADKWEAVEAVYGQDEADRVCLTARGKPLTVADIPAGQGAASLFLMPDSYGDLGVWYRAKDDPGAGLVAVIRGEGIEAPDALIAHLRATLPTIDTTEESP